MMKEFNVNPSAAGERKLYIETYGCQMNVADSEVVAPLRMQTLCCLTRALFVIMPNRKCSHACNISRLYDGAMQAAGRLSVL